MGRRPRMDGVGAWHHVMNRGLARRTVFETRADARQFLAEVAREVRARRLEVHAFTLLTTHFHMLVRSPDGRLAEAMRRIQNAYVRWFNRGRRRDGALFRGRFASRVIEDDEYQHAVVAYIDRNAVDAGVATAPEHHPWSSARHLANARRPPWLCLAWIDARLRAVRRGSPWNFADYSAYFHGGATTAVAAWSDRRMRPRVSRREVELANLAATPPQVLDWMARKAQLADGTRVGADGGDPQRIREAVQSARARHGVWRRSARGPGGDSWRDAEVVLLCRLCGSSIQDAADRLAISKSTAYEALTRHADRARTDSEYARRLSEIIDTVSDTVRN